MDGFGTSLIAGSAAARPVPDPAALPGKTLAAERDIAWVRLAVIVFNVAAYWSVLHPLGIPVLAAAVSVVALAYASYVIAARPYLRWPILRAALFTAVTDSALITLWILATGGYHSPFYLLWFLSLLAVSFRYDARATLAATLLYVACYAALLAALGQLVPHWFDVLVRSVHVALAGALGVLMAHETARAFRARDELAGQVQAEQRRLEERELERLRELDRFRTDFLNAAAHELGTPLTPLQLQTHLLRSEGTPPEARRRAVDIVARNVDRLTLLVQDMLDVARLQSGRVEIRREAVDLAALVHDAIETFRPAAGEKGTAVEAEGPPSLVVAVDPKRTSQILYNLLSNAIKYTPPKGRVTLRYGLGEGGAVRLEVRDTGLGFTGEQRQRMFAPFGRLHVDQMAAPGTGLGLFISRGLAERHGGRLDAESPGPGLGATFTCVLSQHGPPPVEEGPAAGLASGR
jgi:signal transduction histidine kinase